MDVLDKAKARARAAADREARSYRRAHAYRPYALWLAVALCAAAAIAAVAMPQKGEGEEGARRPTSMGIAVRYAEGSVHGFLELRTAAGALLAHGDLFQILRNQGIDSRMVFHFADSSVFDESVTFTQHGVFAMQSYHLVQSGPAFANDLEVSLSRSGAYAVKSRAHKDGKEKQYTGKLDLPPDVYNGMEITIAKNLPARDTETVHVVAFTPEPRVIELEFAPSGSSYMQLGDHAEPVVQLAVKPKLGAFLHLFASLLGEVPADSRIWLITDGVPAFVRFEGPMYSGPIWRINLTSPAWP